ncbi:unnamed protein product [Lampetra fluviatilis]
MAVSSRALAAMQLGASLYPTRAGVSSHCASGARVESTRFWRRKRGTQTRVLLLLLRGRSNRADRSCEPLSERVWQGRALNQVSRSLHPDPLQQDPAEVRACATPLRTPRGRCWSPGSGGGRGEAAGQGAAPRSGDKEDEEEVAAADAARGREVVRPRRRQEVRKMRR